MFTCRRLFLFAAALLFLVPSQTSAQLRKLDETGEHFAGKFKSAKNHPATVAVADFASSDNTLAPQSHYLSWYLSGAIQASNKDSLLVADHLKFDDDIKTIKKSSDPRLEPESVSQILPSVGGDFLIVGTVEKHNTLFLLNLRALRVSDGSEVHSESVEISSSPFLESLSAPVQSPNEKPPQKPGIDGIGMPSCTYAPDPSYTNLARALKIKGVLTVSGIVSVDGTIQNIRPIKMLGYGLDEQAYNTIKQWKCKPALDKNGKAVAVLVPIEVGFRLY
jgi:TonB family protein